MSQRTGVKKLLTAAVIFGGFSLMTLASSPAQACSCLPPPAPKVALEKAAAVFVGKVITIEEKDGRRKEVKILVSKFWKGVTGDSVVVTTAIVSAACGFPFEMNKEYLVYASSIEVQKHLNTSLCTRTKKLEAAGEDLAELGEGSTPPSRQ
jgi:hypothetical protein